MRDAQAPQDSEEPIMAEKETAMNSTIIVVFAVTCFAPIVQAEDKTDKPDGEFQRVLIFDAGSKPAAAAATGHYEWRSITRGEVGMFCDNCRPALRANQIASKPGAKTEVEPKCAAYLCGKCNRLIWRDNGKEIPMAERLMLMSESDREALAQIAVELAKSHDNVANSTLAATEKHAP